MRREPAATKVGCVMGRIRSVKPEVCTSDDMARLSDAAERTYVRLWTHADDEGRGVDNPKLLKAALYPLNDDKTDEVVDALMTELADAGLVVRYACQGRRYFAIPSFPVHQKPRHPTPSKLPPPEQADDSVTAIRGNPTASRRKPPAVVVDVGVDVVPTPDGDCVDAEFEAFWRTYPARDGKKVGKAKSKLLFQRLTADQRRRAATGAANLAASDRLPKDPERFLKRDTAGAFPFDDWQQPPPGSRQFLRAEPDEHGVSRVVL